MLANSAVVSMTSLSTAYSPAPTGLLDATHTAPAVGLLAVQPIFFI